MVEHLAQSSHDKSPRTPFKSVALVLQGGGALGSYQAGVYEALAEAQIHPDWVAGISIGAVNAALIAGNSPERRVDRLREFWETVSVSPFGMPNFPFNDEFTRSVVNQIRSLGILLGGTPGFFQTACAAPVFVSERQSRSPQLLRCHPAEGDTRRPGGL